MLEQVGPPAGDLLEGERRAREVAAAHHVEGLRADEVGGEHGGSALVERHVQLVERGHGVDERQVPQVAVPAQERRLDDRVQEDIASHEPEGRRADKPAGRAAWP
jgi:hypothetical protein